MELTQREQPMVVSRPWPKSAEDAQENRGFLGEIYRSAVIISLVGAILAAINAGWPGLIGFAIGASMALASLRGIELTVRRFMRPEVEVDVARLGVMLMLKLLLLTIVLLGAAWLVIHDAANVIAMVCGVAAVHTVILLKAVGTWLAAVLPPEPVAQRTSQDQPREADQTAVDRVASRSPERSRRHVTVRARSMGSSHTGTGSRVRPSTNTFRADLW